MYDEEEEEERDDLSLPNRYSKKIFVSSYSSWLRAASHPLAGYPVDWPRSARPIEEYPKSPPPKKFFKIAHKVPQKVAQKDPASSWAI